MINYTEKIAALLAPHIEGLEEAEIRDMIEKPADASMGDYALPCFKLAKVLRKAPPMIAKGIAEAVQDDPMFAEVRQVNAYVIMFLNREEFAREVVSEVVSRGEDYGRRIIGTRYRSERQL